MTITAPDLIQGAIHESAGMPEAELPAAPAALPADVVPSLATALPARAADLAASPPPGIAHLEAQEDGAGHYRVRLTYPGAEPRDLSRLKVPPRKIRGAQLSAKDCFDAMTESSASANGRVIRKWINNLLTEGPADLHLVIYDDTELAFPWEMLRLSNTAHDCLGSRVAVTRWLQTFDETPEEKEVPFRAEADTSRGDVVAYFDPDERPKVTDQLAVFDRLARTDRDDLEQFLDLLTQGRDDCGLVYLFCHGFVGSNFLEWEIGQKDETKQRVRRARLIRTPMHLLTQSASLVFLNACDSGRPVVDQEYLCDGRRRGFCDLFLGKGARGFIGTLDEVRVTHAARVAREFLEQGLAHPEAPVARLLRDLRAAALAGWQAEPTPLQLETWFNTFLYVYYGNPLMALGLETKGAANA
jgi:hypothetical protein